MVFGAVPDQVSGLKDGRVSVRLVVASEEQEQAFAVHRHQGKKFVVEFYEPG